MIREQERTEILQEIEALCSLHERISQCDSIQQAREALQRLREVANEKPE